MASLSTDMSSDDSMRHSIHDRIKIVSQQSTARPGCVIQLDAISDATHVSVLKKRKQSDRKSRLNLNLMD